MKSFTKWEGTPFFPRSCAPGSQGGVDCVQLVRALLVDAGWWVQPITWHYPIDGGNHTRQSLIRQFIDMTGVSLRVEEIPPDPAYLRPGDVLGMRLGSAMWHLGIALTPRSFAHVMVGRRVERIPIAVVTRMGAVETIFRPLEL
ncbi:MAG: hypothetical protein ABQ298_03835 [Puniceicoccaceae bacterium]